MGKNKILFIESILVQICSEVVPGAINRDIVPCLSAHTTDANQLDSLTLPKSLSHDDLLPQPIVMRTLCALAPL
ncbi:MAG: hypothetical protein LAP85_06930 [Acidobacteriia bacterium]|nr:hypothetical protein [Terriglobia bacterium]